MKTLPLRRPGSGMGSSGTRTCGAESRNNPDDILAVPVDIDRTEGFHYPPLVLKRSSYPDFSCIDSWEVPVEGRKGAIRWKWKCSRRCRVRGSTVLGIDIGSTSTKAVLVDEERVCPDWTLYTNRREAGGSGQGRVDGPGRGIGEVRLANRCHLLRHHRFGTKTHRRDFRRRADTGRNHRPCPGRCGAGSRRGHHHRNRRPGLQVHYPRRGPGHRVGDEQTSAPPAPAVSWRSRPPVWAASSPTTLPGPKASRPPSPATAAPFSCSATSIT
jgi:hypothetical protein